MEARRAEVGFAPALADLGAQAFVLAAPDVGQLLAFRPVGGSRVEVDRDLEAGRDPLPEIARQFDAGVDGRVAQRDERDHVDGADARMLALVRVHVDLVDGGLDELLEGGCHGSILAGHREDGAVVARVARSIEQRHATDRADRVGHPVDDIEPPAFRHVGHRFDEHALMLATRPSARQTASHPR